MGINEVSALSHYQKLPDFSSYWHWSHLNAQEAPERLEVRCLKQLEYLIDLLLA